MNGRRTAERLADLVDDDRFDVAPNAGSAGRAALNVDTRDVLHLGVELPG